jgi:hypothetical protein
MGSEIVAFFMGFFVATAITMTVLFGFTEHTKAYFQGQVDAVNGTVRVELVKQPDGSSTWRFKK